MLRKIILFLTLSSIWLNSYSQGEFNNWYFGNFAGIDFNSGTPVALTNSAMWAGSGSISVSDSIGNLLFYSNGFQVYNRFHSLMPTGFGLNGTGGSGDLQPIISIKSLVDDSLYYLFTVDYHGYPFFGGYNGLQYSLLDMRLDNGKGDIIPSQKNIKIYGGTSASSGLTAIRHHNNKDAWVVARLYKPDSNYYVSYLLDRNGFDTLPVVSNSLLKLTFSQESPQVREIKISPDGTRLACAYSWSLDSNFVEICSFNSSTGKITPLFLIEPSSGFYGPYYPESIEFSIDSKFLYLTSDAIGLGMNHSVWFQYDNTKNDSLEFKQSETIIGISKRAYIQMAPDGKIYGTKVDAPSIDSLGRINNPSSQGAGCNFETNAFCLNGNYSGEGLPQFVQKYKVYIHHSRLCLGDSIHFSSDIWPLPDSLHWDFGDPTSGLNNFSNLLNPSHLYSNTGTYAVELFVRHIDNRTDTARQTITIVASPQPNLGSAKTICQGDSVLLDAGACAGCTYIWDNLTLGLMNIANTQTYYAKTSANFRVTVTNANGCIGSDTVLVTLTPKPQVTTNPLSESICSGDSTHIILTSSESGTSFNWTASLTSGNVTGFSADSGLIINQTLINNGATTGIVTYHITPKVGSCIGNPVDYNVSVTQGTAVTINITSLTNNVCQGTSVTFNAHTTYGGSSPSFQWKVNGVAAGLNDSVYTYIPANADVVSCTITSSNTVCVSNNPATSNSITMNILPLQPVSVSVSGLNPVCAGTSVTFTALPTNGGLSPTYQWKVNGIVQGASLPAYTYIPLNGDIITCTLLSNAACPTNNPATSPPLTMIVNPNLAVTVSISTPTNPFCLGSSVTFTATPTNGGAPNYQWKVNGVNVGTNSLTYSYFPAGGDVVTCIMNSSLPCTTGNPATSNSIMMVVNTGLPAGVTIAATQNPFCPSTTVTFTATPFNGGINPIYQWKVNGSNVGINSNTYSYNPIDGDSVRCVMQSNLACVTNNPASSAKIIMSGTLAPSVTFSSCFDTITTINAKPIKLKGGIPLGGTYSGAGVNSIAGTFTPSLAGIGTKTVTYTYTNVSLCSAAKTRTIIVQAPSAFSCGNAITDIRDGKTYGSVQIGAQCWMASNLNFGSILITNQDQRDNCLAEKYCYGDSPVNCTTQGGLYQWDEMMLFANTPADQGFCPAAWHVPTENEWLTLFNFFSNNAMAGSPLKYTGFSGFNALMSGVGHMNRISDFQGFATMFWSSNPIGTDKAWAHGMNSPNASVSYYPALRKQAFSIRCIHD